MINGEQSKFLQEFVIVDLGHNHCNVIITDSSGYLKAIRFETIIAIKGPG
ncbi:hypothetical protein ACOMCU_13755 [Lysinibacillus sp. UGB7]